MNANCLVLIIYSSKIMHFKSNGFVNWCWGRRTKLIRLYFNFLGSASDERNNFLHALPSFARKRSGTSTSES